MELLAQVGGSSLSKSSSYAQMLTSFLSLRIVPRRVLASDAFEEIAAAAVMAAARPYFVTAGEQAMRRSNMVIQSANSASTDPVALHTTQSGVGATTQNSTGGGVGLFHAVDGVLAAASVLSWPIADESMQESAPCRYGLGHHFCDERTTKVAPSEVVRI